MEKFGRFGNFASTAYNKLSARALSIVLKAHEATGSNGNRYIQASKRVFLDTQAKSSLIVVDNFQRLNQLKAIGLSEGHISTLVMAHLLLDYTIPPLLIAAAYPIIHNLTGLPPSLNFTVSFFTARAAYGAVTGLTREVAYSILPNPSQE